MNQETSSNETLSNNVLHVKILPLKNPRAKHLKSRTPKLEALQQALTKHFTQAQLEKLQNISGFDLASVEYLKSISTKPSTPEEKEIQALSFKVTEANISILQNLSALRLLWESIDQLTMLSQEHRNLIRTFLKPTISQMKNKNAFFFVFEYVLGNRHNIQPAMLLYQLEQQIKAYDEQLAKKKKREEIKKKKEQLKKDFVVKSSKQQKGRKNNRGSNTSVVVVVRKKKTTPSLPSSSSQ